MKMSITETEFKTALKLLTTSAQKRFSISTQKVVAKIISESESKGDIMNRLEKILQETKSEEEFLTKTENLGVYM